MSTVDLGDMYLKIWDVGGQHSLRRLWTSYYESCHAVVFVIDSTDLGDGELDAGTNSPLTRIVNSNVRMDDPEGDGDARDVAGQVDGQQMGRLQECRLVLESVLASAATQGVPILVLANKQDREDCVETVRIKEGLVRRVFEGEKGGGVRDSRVLPISALKGTGVKEAVEWVRSRVKWNKEGRPPVMR